MHQIFRFFTLIFLTSLTSFAQVEYGKPDELRKLNKVFVDTGGDMKSRERIQEVVEKADLGIKLLDSEEGAEIVLVFGAGKEKHLRGGSGSIVTEVRNVGDGAIYVIRDGKRRVVASYEGEEKWLWEKKPATNFGKMFVKVWKKANGLD